jgi:hypothetical protein
MRLAEELLGIVMVVAFQSFHVLLTVSQVRGRFEVGPIIPVLSRESRVSD